MAQCVNSVERLEILCLMAENPSKTWSAEDVFRAIQSTERTIKGSLDEFAAAALLVEQPPGSFRFAPSPGAATDTALALVKAYRERPVAVIETIYRRPGGAAENFASAFRLRKDK